MTRARDGDELRAVPATSVDRVRRRRGGGVRRPTCSGGSGSSATQITADYAGRPPLLVGVLKGACFFLSDLARAIDLPVEIDFMAVSSYGSATHTSGVVRILKDLDLDLTGRHVLIVEDIVDSGLTLSYLRRNLAARHPASLQVVALLVKDGLQSVDLDLAYEGFRIPPEFVVGYGLDAAERYRNLPFVAVYKEARSAGARGYPGAFMKKALRSPVTYVVLACRGGPAALQRAPRRDRAGRR